MSGKKHAYASRRTWTRIATRTLICFAIQRKHEFNHVHKKKNVHMHLMEDLTSSGVSADPFTCEEIKNKLKNLKEAHKTALDNNADTGAGYALEPLKDLLEQLFHGERSVELSEYTTISAGVGRSAASIPVRSSLNHPATSTTQSKEIIVPTPTSSQSDTGITVTELDRASDSGLSFDDLIEVSIPETISVSGLQSNTPKRSRLGKKSLLALKLEFSKKKERGKQEREKSRQKRHEEMMEAKKKNKRRSAEVPQRANGHAKQKISNYYIYRLLKLNKLNSLK